MTEMDTKRFLTAMQENEEYAIRVAEAKAPEELVALFREIGLEISAEEAADYMAQAKARMESDELDAEMLDAVNGGIGLGYLLTCAAFGAGAGIVLGLVVVGLYCAYRKSTRR